MKIEGLITRKVPCLDQGCQIGTPRKNVSIWYPNNFKCINQEHPVRLS